MAMHIDSSRLVVLRIVLLLGLFVPRASAAILNQEEGERQSAFFYIYSTRSAQRESLNSRPRASIEKKAQLFRESHSKGRLQEDFRKEDAIENASSRAGVTRAALLEYCKSRPVEEHKEIAEALIQGEKHLFGWSVYSDYLIRSVLDKTPEEAYAELLAGLCRADGLKRVDGDTSATVARREVYRIATDTLMAGGIPINPEAIRGIYEKLTDTVPGNLKSDVWQMFETFSKDYPSYVSKSPGKHIQIGYVEEKWRGTASVNVLMEIYDVEKKIQAAGAEQYLTQLIADLEDEKQKGARLKLEGAIVLIDPENSNVTTETLQKAILSSGPDDLKVKCLVYAKRLIWERCQSKEPEKQFKTTYAAWKELKPKQVYGLTLNTQADLEKNLEQVGYQTLLVRLIGKYPRESVQWFKEIVEANGGALDKESQQFFWLGFTSAEFGRSRVPEKPLMPNVTEILQAVEPLVPEAIVKIKTVRDRLAE